MSRKIIPQRGITPRNQQGVTQPKRVYYIIFYGEVYFEHTGDFEARVKKITAFLDFLNRLFGQKGFETAFNGICSAPTFRFHALFVPTEKCTEFEEQLRRTKIPMLLLKSELSTKEEVIKHFKGWRWMTFKVSPDYHRIFEYLVEAFTFVWPVELSGKISYAERKDHEIVKIKWVSKAGIDMVEMLLEFLRKQESSSGEQKPALPERGNRLLGG